MVRPRGTQCGNASGAASAAGDAAGLLEQELFELAAEAERERREHEQRALKDAETILSLRSEIAALKEERARTVEELRARLRASDRENLRLVELIKRANARAFGAKSEKIHPHQSALFNDVDSLAPDDAFDDDDEEKPAPPRPRRKRKKIDWSRFDTTVVEHVMEDGEAICPRCGDTLEEMGYDVRHIVHIVPAHLEVEEHRIRKYRCRHCCDANAAGEDAPSVIVRAQGPVPPLDKSPAGSTLLAHILTQNYVLSQPIYRIADDLSSSLGLPFSRQTLAGWVIRAARTYLAPLADAMAQRLRSRDLIHIDETTVQVLKEPGRSPTTKSWMWVFAAAQDDDPLYVFKYDPSRSRKVPKTFLEGFSGTVITDGYRVYDDLGEGIRRSACAAHIRRKLLDALKAETPAGAPPPENTPAAVGLGFLEKIYMLERRWKDLSPEKRLERRREKLAPVMDKFEAWAKQAVLSTEKGSLIGRALSYAIGEWPHLRLILEDGRIPIDNNLAERAIRPFALGRKNWLFSDTPHGADASAAAYSVITTARAAGLDPYAYLTWLLTEMPEAVRRGDIDYGEFLPIADTIPDSLKAKEPFCFADDPIIDVDPHALDEIDQAEDE